MHYFYIDYETTLTTQISLSKMPLRTYLEQADIQAVAWAWDDEDINAVIGEVEYAGTKAWIGNAELEPDFDDFLYQLTEAHERDDVCVVAHNVAFDVRVSRHKLEQVHPQHVDCSMELSMWAWPNQPGGYGLKNLSEVLGLKHVKLDIDLKGEYTQKELFQYVIGDVAACREIHQHIIKRIPDAELWCQRFTQNQREMHLEVDPSRISTAVSGFQQQAVDHAADVFGFLGAGAKDCFGWDAGQIKSVKPQALKAYLSEHLDFDTETISLKKINPAKFIKHPDAKGALTASSATNKVLTHMRNARKLAGVEEVDVELGYFRAGTGRFSSPSTGKGVNLHNLPKRQKEIAKLIRQIYSLPDEYVFVTCDAANAEYRINGWLSGCKHVEALYEEDILADPYMSFGHSYSENKYGRGDPQRDADKSAVLGLGFEMGSRRWAKEFLIEVMRNEKLSIEMVDELCKQQRWRMPNDKWFNTYTAAEHIPDPISIASYNIRENFRRLHPEFGQLANWLNDTATQVAGATDIQRTLDRCYKKRKAPLRSRLELQPDNTLLGRSVRAKLGPWCPTLAWRDLKSRYIMHRWGLSGTHAKFGYRHMYGAIFLENVVQGCSRNAIVKAQWELSDRGYPYQLTVHDSISLVVPRNRDAVLRARKDIIDVCGPGNNLGFDWAFVINPAEMAVHNSLYEGPEREESWWQDLENGNEDLLWQIT